MSRDFGSARLWAAECIADALFSGARAIDATVGNGHDTVRLCDWVGEAGRVYGFDVQPEAVERTRARLSGAGLINRAVLHCAGHERIAELVPEAVDAAVFNLGWLPGAAHDQTTHVETTLSAVQQAVRLLNPGGVLTVCIYPGHAEGARERDALNAWARALDAGFDAVWKRYVNQQNDPPELLAVRRRR